MALIKSLVLFSMFCSVFSTTDKIIPIGPTATAGPMPPTASVPTLPPVTPPPTNTTSTSTTTTTPKTTSTVTTTTKTTTPTPTTTTTKSTPTTTTTKPTTTATTTTVKPTPPVPPTQGTWVANYTNTNNTCLILQAALQIDVAYMDGNATKMYPVNVPVTAQSDGKCGNDTENITLSWNYQNTISFYFKKNHSKFDLHSIVTMVNVTLPGSNGTQIFVLAHNAEEFPTPVSNSYKCSEKVLNLTSAAQSSNATGQLHITHLQFQAFRNSTSRKFDEALDCAGSETPDVVPIAVGCALAALVIVVLIAYLIGRRRSQARGYLSMFAQNKREEDYIPMKNLSCFN